MTLFYNYIYVNFLHPNQICSISYIFEEITYNFFSFSSVECDNDASLAVTSEV